MILYITITITMPEVVFGLAGTFERTAVFLFQRKCVFYLLFSLLCVSRKPTICGWGQEKVGGGSCAGPLRCPTNSGADELRDHR